MVTKTKKTIKNNNKKCHTCLGFGLWAIGDSSPIGPMDAHDGVPTKPCPECGANKNQYT